MKAPEKIYIDVSLDSAWGMSERSYENEVEYTRTDAFIEKACEFLETYPHMFMGKLRSEMIEDFKEYLKK